MITPQEVASHAFARATLGGYNMAMVDEFLDLLTEDYTALYNDNAILKNKLKLLSETVEEYRATDNAMRKTLLAAQQMADAMVSDAEKKRDELMSGAETAARDRLADIKKQIEAEERRLQSAKEATAAYIQKVTAANAGLNDQLAALRELTDVPSASEPAVEPAPAPVEEPAAAPVIDLFAAAPAEEEPVPVAASVYDEIDPDATRRFEDLQFGKDYEIR